MKRKYKFLLIIMPFVFVLDQFTKWLIIKYIPFGDGVSIIPNYFDIVHVTNKGAAFGMLATWADGYREPFFYFVAIVAILFIIYYFIKLKGKEEKYMTVPLSLILGGIFGNLLDRIRVGEVTDFLSVHINDYILRWELFGKHISLKLSWPAFNVADSAITIAMILLFCGMFKCGEKSRSLE